MLRNRNKREIWRKYADTYIQSRIANFTNGRPLVNVEASNSAVYADLMLEYEEKRFGKIDD